MSDETLRTSIYQSLNLKESEELLQIWQENHRFEWSDTAFEIIREILEERNTEIPAQGEPKLEPDTDIVNNKESDFEGGKQIKLSFEKNSRLQPKFLLWLSKAANFLSWGIFIISVFGLLITLMVIGSKALNYIQTPSNLILLIGPIDVLAKSFATFVILQTISIALCVATDIYYDFKSGVVEEKNDSDNIDRDEEPVFYKTKKVLSIINLTDKSAWVVLGINLFYAISSVFALNPEPRAQYFISILSIGVIITSGLFSFLILKGLSLGLSMLMEYEFNSRGAK